MNWEAGEVCLEFKELVSVTKGVELTIWFNSLTQMHSHWLAALQKSLEAPKPPLPL